MAVIETWYTQDLQKPVKTKYLDGSMFSHNENGNRIGVELYNNGEPLASITGTVSGYVVVSDGTTVPCVGDKGGNRAWILIPAAAYQPGNVFISIFLTDGTTVTTLAAVQTTVLQTRTGTQVDPGSVVADWTQTINAAMQEVETAADNVAGMVANYYSALTFPVPLGKYCIYNNVLYRCISPISSSENWTASHWTQVKLADDVSDLKSALTFERDAVEGDDIRQITITGQYYNKSGSISSSTGTNGKYTEKIPCVEGDKFMYRGRGSVSNPPASYVMFLAGSVVSAVGVDSSVEYTEIAIPSGVDSIVFASFNDNSSSYPDNVVLDVKRVKPITDIEDYIEKPTIKETIIPLDYDYTNSYINVNTGAVDSLSSSILTDYIDIEGIDGFYVSGYVRQTTPLFACYNSGKTYLFGRNNYANGKQYDGLFIAVDDLKKINSNVKYIRFCGRDYSTYPLMVSAYYKGETSSQILSKTEHSKIEYYTKSDGYLNKKYRFTEDANINGVYTNIIPCTPGEVFCYRGRGSSNAPSAIFFSKSGSSLVINSIYQTLSSQHHTEIKIPSGTEYVVFASYKVNPDLAALSVMYADDFYNENVLHGKKWVACGDSFTHGDFTGYTDENGHTYDPNAEDPIIDVYDNEWHMYKTYPYWIGKRNKMTIVLDAINGRTMAVTKKHIDNPTQYPEDYASPMSLPAHYQNIPDDADYITFWFGINDSHDGMTYLGTLSDNTNETFYGAWNVVLQYTIQHHPYAKIGIVCTEGGTNPAYRQAIREVAQKWGIPWLDMMGDLQVPVVLRGREDNLGLTSVAKNLRDASFVVTSQNTHPNLDAHIYQSTFIEHWLRSL